MKRLISLILIIAAFAATAVCAGKAGPVAWSETSHDFGTIKANGGKVTAEYTFVNQSGEPLAIVSVTNGGCGCTEPSFSRKPVLPKAKGKVSITFDPSRFTGEFNRKVTVTIMAGDKRVKSQLKFSGHIIPAK